MKWGELLYQFLSTSPQTRLKASRESFLPYVKSLTEPTLEDVKGIIGISFASVTSYCGDHKTQLCVEEALEYISSLPNCGEIICKVAASILSQERFALQSLSTLSIYQLLSFVSIIIHGVIKALPPLENYSIPTSPSKLQSTSPTLPSLPALLRYILQFIYTLSMQSELKRALKPIKHVSSHPLAMEYTLSLILSSDPILAFPSITLLLPSLEKEGFTDSELHVSLLKVGASSIPLSGPGQWLMWNDISTNTSFLATMTPKTYVEIYLPVIIQALKKSSATSIPVISVILSSLNRTIITSSNTNELLTYLTSALKESSLSSHSVKALCAACTNTEDPNLVQATIQAISTSLGGCKEMTDRVLHLQCLSSIIGVSSRCVAPLPPLLEKIVIPNLKPFIISSPLEVRQSVLNLLLASLDLENSVVPDWVGQAFKDVLKHEDDTLRRTAIAYLARAARLEPKKIEPLVAPLKQIITESEKKPQVRPDAILAACCLINSKSNFAKADVWFKNGIFGDAFLLQPEVLEKLESNSRLIKSVLDLLLIMLPPSNYLPKDLYDPLKQSQSLLQTLLLLAACRHHSVRIIAQQGVKTILAHSKNYIPLLWRAWQIVFTGKSSEELKASKPAAANTNKPTQAAAPPPKGKKAAAPTPSAKPATQAPPTDSSSLSRVPAIKVFPVSRRDSVHLFINVASAVWATCPPTQYGEVLLYCGHPSLHGEVPEDYWLQGTKKYDDYLPTNAFYEFFGQPKLGDESKLTKKRKNAINNPESKYNEQLKRRDFISIHLDDISNELLSALATPNTEIHVAATYAISFLVEVVGNAALQTLLHKERDGILALIDASAIRSLTDQQCKLLNLSKIGLLELIDSEVQEQFGNQQSKDDKNVKKSSKMYSAEDEKWELELKRKKAEESGQDDLTKKIQNAKDELFNKYMAQIQDTQPLLSLIKSGLMAIRCVVGRPENKDNIQLFIPVILNNLLPLLASEVDEIIYLSKSILDQLLLHSDLSSIHQRVSTLICRLVSGKYDPTRSQNDDDGLLTESILPKLRLICQHGAVSASSFSLMFPILKAVLTGNVLVPPKRKPVTMTAAVPIAVAPLAPMIPVASIKKGGKDKDKDSKSTVVIAAPVVPQAPKTVAPVKIVAEDNIKLKVVFSSVTQQHSLTLVHVHCGIRELQYKKDICDVLVKVLEGIPSLYRSTLKSICTLSENLTSSDIPPLIRALFSSNAMIKEAALQGFQSYPYFMNLEAELQDDEENGEPSTESKAPKEEEVDSPEHKELKLVLWILKHDKEAPGVVRISSQLFEARRVQVLSEYCHEIIPYLTNKEDTIRHAASSALSDTVKIYPESLPKVLEEIFASYDHNISTTTTTGEERIGIGYGIEALSCNMTPNILPVVFNFLCSKALLDFRDDCRNQIIKVGRVLITDHGKVTHSEVIPIIRKFIDKPPTGLKGEMLDYYTSALVIWLGTIAPFSTNAKDILPVVDRLVAALDTPSESVHRSVSECLCMLSSLPFMESQVGKLTKNFINKMGKGSFAQKKGSAFGLAGLAKGRRLPFIKQYNVMGAIYEGTSSKNSNIREGALIFFEVLCQVIGWIFEPYAIDGANIVLSCFADKDGEVKAAADDASKAMMKILTDHGVRQLLPRLLRALDDTNWRTKVTSVELLGSMAYCSPKQLAACLPSIIPKLTSCLADTHQMVSTAAFSSLKRVGGVIVNQEISQHVDVLLKALERPSTETDNALEALLFTRFVNSVDAPALALIFPILHRGLRERGTTTKMKAAQIVGSLSQLLTDANIMVPYLGELVPLLKITLTDPIPEVRTTSAKALGTLVRGLGEPRFPSLIDWLLDQMKVEGSGVERSGAAQGLCEVVAAIGVSRLDSLLPDLLINSQHPKAQVKEGYLQVFVYLPHTMGTTFQPYLSKILPRVLQGLSDDAEMVRMVALKAGQTIVQYYGQNCLTLLLPALQDGLSSEQWRIRHSSLLLIGDLLMRVATNHLPKSKQVSKHESDSEEEEEEEEEEDEEEEESGPRQSEQLTLQQLKRTRKDKSTNSCVAALQNVIGDSINRILATMYMMKSDVQVMVRNEANTIWKALVDNTPSMLRKIIPDLISLLVNCLACGETERRVVAGRALGELVAKLGDSVVPTLIPILQKGLNNNSVDTRHGVCLGFAELLASSSKTQLNSHMDELIPTITAALCDSDEGVRATAATAFDQLFKQVGYRSVEEIVARLMETLLKKPLSQSETAVLGLEQLIVLRAKAVLSLVVPELTNATKFSESMAFTIQRVAETSKENLSPHLSALLPIMVAALGDNLPYHDKVQSATVSVIKCVDEESIPTVMHEIRTSIQNANPNIRRGGAGLVACFCPNVDKEVDWDEHIPVVIQNTIRLYADKDDSVCSEAIKAMQSLTTSISSEKQIGLLSVVHSAITIASRGLSSGASTTSLPALSKPGSLDPILPYYLKSIPSSDMTIREAAARGMGELTELTPLPQLEKCVSSMIGPLLRIVNEKTIPSTRQAILETLSLLILNSGVALKHFCPQLHSTFVKAINDDTTATRLAGLVGMKTLLSKYEPKIDPIVMEITNALKIQKVPNIQASLLHGLSLVLSKKKVQVSPVAAQASMNQIPILYSSPVPYLKSAAAKAMGLLALALPDKLEETVEVCIRELSNSGDRIGAFSLASGLLQGVPQILEADVVKKIINSVASSLDAKNQTMCLYALRVMEKAFRNYSNLIPSNIAVQCVKSITEVIVTGSLHGTRLDRKALSCLVAISFSTPTALQDLPQLVDGLIKKDMAKGDEVFSSMTKTCLYRITKNCDISKLGPAMTKALQPHKEKPKNEIDGEESEIEEETNLLNSETI